MILIMYVYKYWANRRSEYFWVMRSQGTYILQFFKISLPIWNEYLYKLKIFQR